MRKLLCPKAKVILFYHAIPTDLAWMNDELPYKVPTETEQVRERRRGRERETWRERGRERALRERVEREHEIQGNNGCDQEVMRN